MKVLTILGTRPEIIRLSAVIEQLDARCEHVLVHTGQNYERSLHEIFFSELGVRAPDGYLGVRGETLGDRLAAIVAACDRVLTEVRPGRVLVLGDTDSALSAFVARRRGIRVFHMEAGNRCFDERVPEEVNRRVIDHASDVLLPYSQRSRQYLLREGIAPERVHVTGNPIYEVMTRHGAAIDRSDVLARLGLEPNGYLLLTAHRQENVDVASRLRDLAVAVRGVARETQLPVICSVHPRLRSRLEGYGVELARDGVQLHEPFGFFDFVALERGARCVLTDSGTVQEECCILGTPAVTIRDATERPETIECGSNVLSGVSPEMVLRATRLALERPRDWAVPAEYRVPHVSATVAGIVLGPLRAA